MAGWILSGYIGAGKTCFAVRWMAEYMAEGHRVFTNVPVYGWCEEIHDLCPMVVASPIIGVMRRLGWQYQPHQFVYVPYEAMAGNPGWFKLVPAGASRDDKMLAVIDECSDLFDVNDRDSVRRTDNTIMRECLRFIRLSRHAHIEVVFLMQNEGLTMAALTKLCEHRLKVINFAYFFQKFHLPFAINKTLVTHTLNHGAISAPSRIIQSNDRAIWNSYKSEAFQQSIGVESDGVFIKKEAGKLKNWKKKGVYPMWFKIAAVAGVVLAGVSFRFSVRAISLANDQKSEYARFLTQSKSLEQKQSLRGFVSDGRSASSAVAVAVPLPVKAYDCEYGEYMYHSAGSDVWADFRGCRLDVGGPSEWGDILKVNEHYAIAKDASGRCTVLCQSVNFKEEKQEFADAKRVKTPHL